MRAGGASTAKLGKLLTGGGPPDFLIAVTTADGEKQYSCRRNARMICLGQVNPNWETEMRRMSFRWNPLSRMTTIFAGPGLEGIITCDPSGNEGQLLWIPQQEEGASNSVAEQKIITLHRFFRENELRGVMTTAWANAA